MRQFFGTLAALLLSLTVQAVQAAEPDTGAVASFRAIHYDAVDPSAVGQKLPLNTYRNPIIPGFHPDPSIVRVGADYYLVNSSFSFFPGLPIFQSHDLAHWTQIGNAIAKPDLFDFRGLGIARGVFAPTLRYHHGTFFIINTCVECGGNYLMTAQNPRGPWSKPKFLPEVDGIDPDLFVDDDGRAWVANNGAPTGTPRYDGHRAIWLQELDLKSMQMIGPRTVIVDGGVHPEKRPIWTEGPHIFRRRGYYYLITAEGGTAGQHSETVYRARSVTGPFEAGPVNPILTQRDLDPKRANPVYATGHADFVETATGAWWAVFLGTRPYRDNLSSMGRETFMLPVRWVDGWPIILPAGQAVPMVVDVPHATTVQHMSSVTSKAGFDLGWVMLRTPAKLWAQWTKSGTLRLTAQVGGLSETGNPSFLARRQEQRTEAVSVDVDYAPTRLGDHAGLALFSDERHFYTFGISQTAAGRAIVVRLRNGVTDPAEGRIVASIPLAKRAHRATLRLDIRDPECAFSYRLPRRPWANVLEHADTWMLASEASNQFTGAVVGPFAARASADK